MKTKFLQNPFFFITSLLLVLSLGPALGHADDDVITHELSGISELELFITHASITLVGSDRSGLDLTLEKPMLGFDPDNIEQSIEQHGDKLVIKIEYKKSGGGWWWSSDKKGYSHAQLLIPRNIKARIRTSGGNISAESMNAPLILKTSGGNVAATDIAAPVELDTSGGNIRLRNIDGDTDAHTSGGNIMVDGMAGKAKLNTSGGNITIKGSVTALKAHTSGGHIDASIDSALSEPLELRTSGGNVNATLNAGMAAPADLSTSGGNVTIALPKDQSFALYAKSNGGRVSLDHSGTFSGQLGKKKIEGDINGGGPLVKMNTNGGRVRVAEI